MPSSGHFNGAGIASSARASLTSSTSRRPPAPVRISGPSSARRPRSTGSCSPSGRRTSSTCCPTAGATAGRTSGSAPPPRISRSFDMRLAHPRRGPGRGAVRQLRACHRPARLARHRQRHALSRLGDLGRGVWTPSPANGAGLGQGDHPPLSRHGDPRVRKAVGDLREQPGRRRGWAFNPGS